MKGIDFNKIFLPVVKMFSIKVVLALAASINLEVEQFDVKMAFLHEDLHKTIYMEYPEGFEVKRKKQMVYKLQKSLYSLKKARKQRYKKFDFFIEGHGFKKSIPYKCTLTLGK